MISKIIEAITSEHALEKYSDRNRLLGEAVPYIGEPRLSASDPGKVFLRINPLSSHGELLEFKNEDVLFAENVETVADKEGGIFQIVKIWVRIGSIGLKLEPFSVQDYSNVLDSVFDVLADKK
ncbi:MAG: hypothetical protein ACJAT7_000918 [Psychromonas sp.]|jgi:hypothetical protein|uniref:hypothetical protein n=1 Tax=Psychromonas sp. TaxID=1884585 RepID=UPI0039E29FD0